MEFFNNINTMLVNSMGPLGPLVALGGLGLLLVLAALPTMLKKKIDPFAKVKAQRASSGVANKPGDALRKGDKNDKLEKFANFLEPQNAEDMSTARMKMLRAGYRGKNSVRTFHFAQFSLGILFLLLGLIYAMILSSKGDVSTQKMILLPSFQVLLAITCRNIGSSAAHNRAKTKLFPAFLMRLI